MTATIFTNIINGNIPCHKIFEDELTFAFLDIHPVQKGHTLVVSKLQIDQFQDLPEKEYAAVWHTVQKISIRLKEVMKSPRIGVHVEGFMVPHAHVHVMPIYTGFKDFTPSLLTEEPDHKALAALAKQLSFA
ncbi:MAG: hypothetical protein NVSMB46_00210 [Candidatus Saccharimonadales bacterium]